MYGHFHTFDSSAYVDWLYHLKHVKSEIREIYFGLKRGFPIKLKERLEIRYFSLNLS